MDDRKGPRLLDEDGLRALAVLRARHADLLQARVAYYAAEQRCSHAGVSHRQMAAITGQKAHNIYRRLKGENMREVL